MANKLRDIFNEEKEVAIGTIIFSSKEDAEEFTQALQKMYKDGEAREIHGIKSLKMGYKDGDNQYPIEEQSTVKSVIIGPCKDNIELDVDGLHDMKTIHLEKIDLQDRIVLQNDETEVVTYRLALFKGSNIAQITYSTAINKASSLQEIYDSFVKARAFFEKMFIDMEATPEIKNTHQYLKSSIRFYHMLIAVNEVLNLNISPNDLADEQDGDFLLEKIYFLICKHRILKTNNKINHITGVNLPEKDDENSISNGIQLIASFVSKWNCELFGKEFDIYTSNVVFNAIVDRVDTKIDGNTKVFFSDTEDARMYISTKGFLNTEDADEEVKKVFDGLDEYKNAKTVIEHIRCFQDSI